MYQLYTCYCNKHEYPHLVTVLGNFGGTVDVLEGVLWTDSPDPKTKTSLATLVQS